MIRVRVRVRFRVRFRVRVWVRFRVRVCSYMHIRRVFLLWSHLIGARDFRKSHALSTGYISAQSKQLKNKASMDGHIYKYRTRCAYVITGILINKII